VKSLIPLLRHQDADTVNQTQTADSYVNLIPALETAFRCASPSILGYHLEGPFISSKKPGCHPQDNLRMAENRWKTFLDIYGENALKPTKALPGEAGNYDLRDMVKIITVAPELQGIMKSIRRLKHAGFVISIGHS
jgi:N-acetylglucosamine-6-phosphate deacetylase